MTIKALQNMPPGAEKTAAAMKLLGKQGMELMPLLNQTAEETDALRQKAHDLGMVMASTWSTTPRSPAFKFVYESFMETSSTRVPGAYRTRHTSRAALDIMSLIAISLRFSKRAIVEFIKRFD
jgi:hypothetical protein